MTAIILLKVNKPNEALQFIQIAEMAAQKLVQMNLLEPLGVEEQEFKQVAQKDLETTEDSKDMFSDPIKIENDSSHMPREPNISIQKTNKKVEFELQSPDSIKKRKDGIIIEVDYEDSKGEESLVKSIENIEKTQSD